MRIKKNADYSILNDMDGILSNEEYISLFSPIKKEAQVNVPQGQHYSPPAREHTPIPSPSQYQEDSDSTGENVYAPDTPIEVPQVQVSTEQIKRVLGDIVSDATFADPATKAAAQSVYQGQVSDSAVQALSRFFSKEVTLEQLKKAFETFAAQSKQASISNVVPVVVKIANTLNSMGFELSELVADKLLRTITIEARAKVKAKKEKEEKEKEEKAKPKAKAKAKKEEEKEDKAKGRKNCWPKKLY